MLKNIKNEDGFTISEIIVSISLGIIIFSMVIGFYLFFNNLFYSNNKNTFNKIQKEQIFNVLNKKLISSEYFTVNTKNNSIFFNDSTLIQFTGNSLVYNSDTLFNNLDSVKIVIKYNGSLSSDELVYKDKFSSSEIEKIGFFSNNHFVLNYYVPKFNIKGFKNFE